MSAALSMFERIERKIIPEPNSGCWLWLGAIGSHGYGQVRPAPGQTSVVHKLLYEQKNGPVPKGLQLDHLCRLRCCVNPDHLEVVTQRENGLRGLSPMAIQARQTHCKRGHPLAGDNLITHKNKWGNLSRKCRTCHLQYRKDNRERIKARMRAYYFERKMENQK